MSDEIIICVPGNWNSHQELVSSLIEADTGYIYAGMIMKDLKSEHFAKIEECEPDSAVTKAFVNSSYGRYSEQELKGIENHSTVVYAICDGGSVENVRAALAIGKALLKAGGLAIKVETSGVSHPKSKWLEFSNDSIVDLFTAFIVVVTYSDTILSCGMHNFGEPDGIIDNRIEYASYTLQTFLIYILDERPKILLGQTFSAEEDMETVRIDKRKSIEFYDVNDLYSNPYDVWSLDKA